MAGEATASRRFRVVSSVAATPAIRHLVLAPLDGVPPAWAAGAHVRVALPDGGDRPYSLMALPGVDPAHWSLGVLLEEKSTGGSRYMHTLRPGDEVALSEPVNHFALEPDDAPALLFAGGIGITPILAMAAELKARGVPFALHYAGRAPGLLAFLEPLRTICGDALAVHYDGDASRLDIDAALAAADPAAHVYVCGPAGMTEAVKAAARARGIPPERIHFELFAAAAPAGADVAFEVEIASTGRVVRVEADQSIVAALEAAGLDPLHDCLRGDCGICQCGVLDGVPDHRDVILTDAERASNKVMQICVSRAKTPRLVLDL